MSRYLLSSTEVYRVDSEGEAKKLIEEAKVNSIGTVPKYSSVYKTQKQKGEIIDSWYKVTITHQFQEEKEPDSFIISNYAKESAF